MVNVTPNQSAIQTALRNFLVGVLPAGVDAVEGQDNRVSEPQGGDYVVFWPLRRPRLAFNVDTVQDAVFTGSIAGTTLTITAVNPKFSGQIVKGNQIFGVGLASPTIVTAFITGTGGIGTYTVSSSQTIASETISAGTQTLMQETEVVIQCDVHGPNASDNVQIISTAFLDDIANTYFNPSTTGVYPLYCDDPIQIPFINGEDQYENRYTIDVHLQVDQTVTFGQQFADTLTVPLESIDVVYPP